VETDALLKAAYESAEAAAKKFAESARKTSFSRAALDSQRAMTSTGNFEPNRILQGDGVIPNFLANRETTSTLAMKAIELLSQASPADPHPIGLVPLPAEHKVIVAQLGEITMPGTEADFFREKMEAAEQFQNRFSEDLAARYFDYPAVCARLDFHPDESAKNPG